MDKIIWDESFSVGNEILDNQHQNILRMINELIDNRQSNISSEKVTNILDDLMLYVRQHIDYEEVILEQLDYPEFSQHKSSHLLLQEQLAELMYGASEQVLSHGQYDDNIPKEVLEFLMCWWQKHILVEDMKYKSLFVG